jgi:tetratricopeptide (TPR) repeat protein
MRPGRNDPCPCGSGRKYKHCCGTVTPNQASAAAAGVPGHGEIDRLVVLIEQERPGDAEREARALLRTYPDTGILWKILSVALLRQGKEALPELRRTTVLMPEDVEAHRNLGATLCARGQWEEALASLRRALAIAPDDAEALNSAANALRALGRAQESIALYQRALGINSRFAEAQNNLGNAYLELGQCAEATACYRLALELQPQSAHLHCNLGNALRQLGQFDEAVEASRHAIALEPRLAPAHLNLGVSLTVLGQREQAVASYRQAIALNPGYSEALENLANTLRDLGQRREALDLYRQGVELQPQRAESHCNLGNALFELRQLEEALASFERALALRADYPAAHLGLAATLRMLDRAAEAEASCSAALAIDREHPEALVLLGELQADRGRFTEAREQFERAIARDPRFAPAYCSVAAHRRMTGTDQAWLADVQALLSSPLPLRDEVSLRYALGKYWDDVGNYDEAFVSYRQANELSKRYGWGYDHARLAARVDRIIDTLTGTRLRALQAYGLPSELPVFIIGMPRSGTSLSEQILASHQAVFGAGEVRHWDGAYTALERAGYPEHNTGADLARLARDYLERVKARAGAALRVIDKMPANFLYAGLIHAAFPGARFIQMKRHPIDTCLSIYFQDFYSVGPYVNDLGNIAHYYGEYLRIMRHWRTVLPAVSLLEVPYESLIADQEGWTRRMLEFIGLPWDPRCLEFERADRVVITASRWQVRQGITTASAGRWRNYEKYVAPLQHLVSLAREDSPSEPATTAESEQKAVSGL